MDIQCQSGQGWIQLHSWLSQHYYVRAILADFYHLAAAINLALLRCTSAGVIQAYNHHIQHDCKEPSLFIITLTSYASPSLKQLQSAVPRVQIAQIPLYVVENDVHVVYLYCSTRLLDLGCGAMATLRKRGDGKWCVYFPLP